MDKNLMDLSEPKTGIYGEWVYYESEEDKEKAIQYLQLWKHFIMQKLSRFKIKDEQMVEKKDLFGNGVNTLGIKILVE